MSAQISPLSHQPVAKVIYNHDIMHCTAEGVVENHLYSGRALGLTEPWDMIQLHEDLKPLWNDITAHYDRIGLTYTKDVIWYLSLKELGAHVGYIPSVFYFGSEEYSNWGDSAWYEIVEFITSKNNFMSLAKELDIDIPTTLCFDNVAQINDDNIKEINFPCYLKAAVPVSDVGIYRCENKEELIENQFKVTGNIPVQIQEEIITDTFINMQYMVIDDEVIRLTTSEKIMDGSVHQGNRVPACREPWDQVERMAVWLKDHGMKGVFSFDIAVAQTENGLRFPAIKCKPGFIDSSYPGMIAQKLNIKEWSTLTFSTKYRNLRDIDLSDIEYDKNTSEGMIIINWGTVLSGKLKILTAGSIEYQEVLKAELEARLC